VDFLDTASAGNSHFTMSGSAVSTTGNSQRIGFFTNATAGDSVITVNGGTVDGAIGGLLEFFNSSTAGNATLIANDGAPGPRGGGRIFFLDDSTGGTANVMVHGIGKLDLSMHNPGSVGIAFLEGDGNVFLGGCELVVAVPSQFYTGFDGVIQDGGFSGGVGGRFAKNGGGYFVLTNANTYSGGTSVNGGILEVAHDGALGSGNVSVDQGILFLSPKGAHHDYISDVATLSVVTQSTVGLGFSGNPEVIASLLVNGVPQPGGLYGSSTSGAPNQLPELWEDGTILVVNTQAFSRKVHGTQFFDIDLPLNGRPGVECRSGGANGDFQLVVTFSRPVSFANAAVTSGAGSIQSTSGNNSPALTINLTGVADAQTVIVTLSGVNYGGNTGSIAIPVSFLIGDTSGNGSVNSSDVSQTKSRAGAAVTSSDFRSDVTANGSINASDVSLVKSRSGTSLP
jgi:autotransporter-associated beta strand protein